MTNAYNAELLNAVRECLDNDDIHYSVDETNGLIHYNVNMGGRLNTVQYFIFVSTDGYIVYVISPISAKSDDPAEMQKLAEFICRANYGLKYGNFELDFDDAMLRFKVYISCIDYIPNMRMIRKSVLVPGVMLMKYIDGILKVLFSNISPKDAVDMCEGHKSSSESSSNDSSDSSEGLSAALLELLESISNGNESSDNDDDGDDDFTDMDDDDDDE